MLGMVGFDLGALFLFSGVQESHGWSCEDGESCLLFHGLSLCIVVLDANL